MAVQAGDGHGCPRFKNVDVDGDSSVYEDL